MDDNLRKTIDEGFVSDWGELENATPKEMARRIHADANRSDWKDHFKLVHTYKWTGLALMKLAEAQSKVTESQSKFTRFSLGLSLATVTLSVISVIIAVTK